MKSTTLSICFLLLCQVLFSQTVKIPLSKGGSENGGTVLQVNVNNGNYIATNLSGLIGTNEQGLNVNNTTVGSSSVFYESSNNSLYIVAKFGFRPALESDASGTIFRYDLTTQATHLIKEFSSEETSLGQYSIGDLQKVGNLLYGVTQEGGAFGFGCIFSVDPSNDAYSVVHSFNGTTDGGEPTCSLFKDGNILYGAGKRGNGIPGEVYFSYDVSNNTYSALFTGSNSSAVKGLLKRNSSLYVSKGNNVWELDLNNPSNGLSIFFLGAGANLQLGATPGQPTFRTGDTQWYTILQNGGLNNLGSIARYDFSSSTLVSTHNFQGGSLGQGPENALVNGLNGDIVGIAATGVSDNYVLYRISSIGVYSVLHEFNTQNEGLNIKSSPVLVGSKLYGIAEGYGQNYGGTIWSYDFANSTFSVEAQLGYANGKSPVSGLVMNPSTNDLSFTCFQGGTSNKLGGGTINSINSSNSITKISNLDDFDIHEIHHKPMFYNGNTYILFSFTQGQIGNFNSLYGIGELDLANGTVSNIIPVAPVTDILDIVNSDVRGNIIQDGSKIYGLTRESIWSIDLSNSTNSILYTFNSNVDGNLPSALILDGNALFGINTSGGSNNVGTIFSLDLSNNSYTVIQDIPANQSFHGITKASNNLYSVNNDGSSLSLAELDLSSGSPAFQNMASIDPSSIGSIPGPNLSNLNGFVYGVLNSEGANNLGGLFKYEINTSTVSNIISFDETTGHFAYNSEILIEPGSLSTSNLNPISSIEVFPNPSNDIFIIKSDETVEAAVYDLNGRVILQKQTTNTVNLEGFNSGVYLLKITIGNSIYTTRIIKE